MPNHQAAAWHNITQEASHSPSNPTTSSISSTAAYVSKNTSFGQWIQLGLIGAVLETIRRISLAVYTKIFNTFFVTVTLQDIHTGQDISMNMVTYWVSGWLGQFPSWSRPRDMHLGAKSISDSLVDISPESLKLEDSFTCSPSVDVPVTFWYKGHWIRAYRGTVDDKSFYYPVSTFTLCILAWNKKILNELLLEAKLKYEKSKASYQTVAVSAPNAGWRYMTRGRRPFESVVLDPGVQEYLHEDALDFMLSKNWYASKGIPFRRGYLLFGPPGTGKTSVIQALASKLDLPIFIISLTRPGMDDSSLAQLIAAIPEKAIALMEDIDVAFSHAMNRRDLGEEDEIKEPGNSTKAAEDSKPSQPSSLTSKVTLSGLLNALDGAGAQEGRLLFATTNKVSSLDPALCRPGRMDVHLELKLASKYQARKLFRLFYHPDIEAKDSDKDSAEHGDPDDLYAKAEINRHQKLSCQLSIEEVETLAERFAAAVPEREFSVAALQGYLMTYKIRPREAAVEIEEWVKKQKPRGAAKIV
ncbi:P-loop containing nucleoside triphosphate hydrolase protein [Coprinopsis marcescibilis]|uniref:P-loop containing nucleoside triphosphate hydrolase protein n=1 Tax=Coprinopsis marcescibilis TaxID=230819 RepID=A0A5C3LB60_COPMA|nr:P-loop containing nucleoside triphosphate hydrolase protein [Coprinopsis marcescibilis]